jgi:sugar lactone lactonase YvrE
MFAWLLALSGVTAVVAAFAADAPEPDAGALRPQVTPRVDVIAGTGGYGFYGDGGPATEALLWMPEGVAVDSTGNLYIAEFSNHRIRCVSPNGIIETIAGGGPPGKFGRELGSGDGGPALRARLNCPHAMVVDSQGRLFVADWLDHRVRRITPDGMITTVTGMGKPGFSGDGGPAAKAMLSSPHGLAVDGAGNLLIADYANNRIRKVNAEGTISTIAGGGTLGPTESGRASEVRLNLPTGIALDAAGNLYIAEQRGHCVRKMTPAGVVTTIAGAGKEGYSGDGGPATKAALRSPGPLAVDRAGALFIVTWEGVRKVAPDGTITTVAGAWTVPVRGFTFNRTPIAPVGLAIDGTGNLFVAYNANFVVRITNVAAPGVLPAAPKPTDPIVGDDAKPADPGDEGKPD